jgi:hypothetical protein
LWPARVGVVVSVLQLVAALQPDTPFGGAVAARVIVSVVQLAIGSRLRGPAPSTKGARMAEAILVVQLILAWLLPPLGGVARLAQVASVATGGVALLVLPLRRWSVAVRTRATTALAPLAVAVVLAEALAELSVGPAPPAASPSLLRAAARADERFGWRMPPGTVLDVDYRGSQDTRFREADRRSLEWSLRVAGRGRATVVLPPDPHVVRIDVQARAAIPYDVQLNRPGFPVTRGRDYVVQFTARSDRPRRFYAGFARAHGDWQGLGLYALVDVGPAWTAYRLEFTATDDDSNGRVFFDAGDAAVPFEVASVRLAATPGRPIEPAAPPAMYRVTYRFDAHGCRSAAGRPSPGERRPTVLILGNAYSMGAGIDADQSMAGRLASHEASGRVLGVLNCGSPGYDIARQRRLYEEVGTRVGVDVVVVAVSPPDDTRSEPGLPGRWAGPFRLLRPPRGRWTISTNDIAELRQLADAVRRRQGRIGVLLFRNNADAMGTTVDGRQWNDARRDLTGGLVGSGVDVIDIAAGAEPATLLAAHAPLGFAPNTVAHRLAADAVARWLD